jgi:hypothetical protein
MNLGEFTHLLFPTHPPISQGKRQQSVKESASPILTLDSGLSITISITSTSHHQHTHHQHTHHLKFSTVTPQYFIALQLTILPRLTKSTPMIYQYRQKNEMKLTA